MADNVPSYVPRSPDLSGLKHEPGGALPPLGIPQHTSSSSTYTPPADFAVSQQPFAAQPYQDHGYSISSYSWPQQQEPQSFYAPQQQQQPNSYPLSPSSTNAPQPPAPGQSKPRRGRPPKSGPGAAKDHDWQSAGEKHVFPSNWQDPAAGDIKIQEDEEESQKPPPGEVEDIRVKTKFPVARIKRIVQADEDVGKVAQSTPVAVCTSSRDRSPTRHVTIVLTFNRSQSPRAFHDILGPQICRRGSLPQLQAHYWYSSQERREQRRAVRLPQRRRR